MVSRCFRGGHRRRPWQLLTLSAVIHRLLAQRPERCLLRILGQKRSFPLGRRYALTRNAICRRQDQPQRPRQHRNIVLHSSLDEGRCTSDMSWRLHPFSSSFFPPVTVVQEGSMMQGGKTIKTDDPCQLCPALASSVTEANVESGGQATGERRPDRRVPPPPASTSIIMESTDASESAPVSLPLPCGTCQLGLREDEVGAGWKRTLPFFEGSWRSSR